MLSSFCSCCSSATAIVKERDVISTGSKTKVEYVAQRDPLEHPPHYDVPDEEGCCSTAAAVREMEENGVGELKHTMEVPAALPLGPVTRLAPTFLAPRSNRLIENSEPMCSGSIVYYRAGEQMVQVILTLYVEGFSIYSENEVKVARAWSPFSAVEHCSTGKLVEQGCAIFKLTYICAEGSDRFYYFCCRGKDAVDNRDRWVEEFTEGIRKVTTSLFPPHAIIVSPLKGVASTSSRIMAGYLLQSGGPEQVCLVYCELHAFCGGLSRIAIYRDEWCEREIMSLYITENTVVNRGTTKHCTVFMVDGSLFCARSDEEKELWIRAVNNIKVKLTFSAPDPSREDINLFRQAVNERVGKLKIVADPGGPLLPLTPRTPLQSPRGDDDGDPCDDAASTATRSPSMTVPDEDRAGPRSGQARQPCNAATAAAPDAQETWSQGSTTGVVDGVGPAL
mmetsp:Transcript_64471/g.153907  ORF Transcript_64471/g.153907 Transcript_64471/m.153907 type:complete len:450 (+) Transcript_64471:169-1518(+)